MTGFKKAVIFSFLGHLTIFGIFSFSFADKTTMAGYSEIYFMGGILNNLDVKPFKGQVTGKRIIERSIKGLFDRGKAFLPKSESQELPGFLPPGYIKPWVNHVLNGYRTQPVLPGEVLTGKQFIRKMPPVMFYPQLPYNFSLYFKDRQVAHIELAFVVVSQAYGNSLTVKRKISSGNLETDLLSMRYISRYLSLQQESFAPGEWQTVKIDLSKPSGNNIIK